VLSRGVLALNGDFSVFERNYNWDVALTYGSSRTISSNGLYVFQNVQNALNATRNGSGNIVCAGSPVAAAVATGSSSCAPLNLFGLGSPSAAALAYVTHDALAKSINTQRDASVNLNGPILKLPAGDWKGAVGFENRRESADFEPDDFYTGNFGQITATPVAGAYRTNEIYAETLIPVFEPAQDLPALHQLEIEGAVRRVSNSIAGTATTWTGGLRWSPVADIQFRANKTKSIRAPAITELFLPATTNFEFSQDPCDQNYVTQGTAPARRAANCAAAGIDTRTFVSNVVNATAKGLTSGNAHLVSETADSKTFGVVLRPRWVPHLIVSVDYIEINLTDAIEQLNLQEVMDACYDAADYPNNASCGQFTRDANHQVSTFHDGFVNAGLLDFQAISASAEYSLELPRSWGRMNWRANYLDTRKLVQVIGTASPQTLAGELGGANPFIAVPKGKAAFDVEYSRGPFSWLWRAQYYSGLNFDNSNTANSQDILRVNPWWLIDSTLSYEVSDKFTSRLIVNNVFNKEPPYPALAGTGGNNSSATSLYFPGIIGRTYLLSFSYRF
jgi:outer membrane receptor protein involved in Fe transport